MWKLWRILLAVALVGAVARPMLAEEEKKETSKEDRAELRAAQRQLHSRDETQRVEGVQRLSAMPGVEAAKIIVAVGLIDSSGDVRRAAYNALRAWRDDPEVGVLLLRTLNRESRARKKGLSCVVPLTMILLAAKPADTQRDLAKFLDAFAASPENVRPLVDAADELGNLGDEASLASLRRMTELKCFASTFGFRRAVVQALIQVRLPKAIEALIDLLPKTDGVVHGDILRQLVAVAGQIPGADDKAWAAWWKKHKGDFKFPPPEAKPLGAEAAGETPSYYGLAIEARRIVFVIDISGSMRGARLEAAQRELMQAIDKLPEDTSFSIVSFSDRTTVWRKTLMPATSQTKQAARVFVYLLRAGGRTAAYDALEAAFRFDAEAIYFLSDGEPNAGKIPKPDAILKAVSQTDRARRISIYTIGIAPGEAGGPLDSFMRTLAENDFGAYRRVEQ
jgi:hypothetical protein